MAPPVPPQAPPPPAPSGGLGPGSPLAGMLSDLSPSMTPGWQSLDLAARALKVALRSVDFQKIPAVVAVVQSVLNTISELISHYQSGTAGGPASKSAAPRAETTPPSPSSDADSQPSMTDGAEPEGEG